MGDALDMRSMEQLQRLDRRSWMVADAKAIQVAAYILIFHNLVQSREIAGRRSLIY
ncbi:hypothetical protein Ae505Ps2_5952c [Pseudonocardia sp. Ae505_Ps2]|nr:hypothetical protein Ae505Ps2_5952c [Pseudonocardia sp. Ae505_Ps2]